MGDKEGKYTKQRRREGLREETKLKTAARRVKKKEKLKKTRSERSREKYKRKHRTVGRGTEIINTTIGTRRKF